MLTVDRSTPWLPLFALPAGTSKNTQQAACVEVSIRQTKLYVLLIFPEWTQGLKGLAVLKPLTQLPLPPNLGSEHGGVRPPVNQGTTPTC